MPCLSHPHWIYFSQHTPKNIHSSSMIWNRTRVTVISFTQHLPKCIRWLVKYPVYVRINILIYSQLLVYKYERKSRIIPNYPDVFKFS
jgi:hypothetical protein